MKAFASLTNRIFFATAVVAVVSIAVAVFIVNKGVTQQAEGDLERGLQESATLVDEYRNVLFEHFRREARLIADLPVLKAAAFDTSVETLRPIAQEYKGQLNADLFDITDRRGNVLVHLADAVRPDSLIGLPGIQEALKGKEMISFRAIPQGILQVVTVPITIGRPAPEVLGTLTIGLSLNNRQAETFKSLTASDVAFGAERTVRSSTLPPESWDAIGPLLDRPGATSHLNIDGEDFVAFTRLLVPEGHADSPRVIVLRSETERLRFLGRLHTYLGGIALLAVFAATILSYAIARTVARPMAAITGTMRDMATTGDLTRKIPIRPDAWWQDEDAYLMATTFNAMTDSIQRFQREAAQRERLSSLGRLSTVVAHEIRNPLMIIKTALRTMRREDVKPEVMQSAVRDIDEEIARLNRIVTEVLDFARPIKFDLESADLNAVARDAVKATAPDGEKHPIRLGLDPALPAITTDADRLRQVLVNVLSNAVQAVEARADGVTDDAPIRLETQRVDSSRVVVTVRDKGVGITPENLSHVFDPYFTTRRTGTGIGLAISRNIVEGLGGRISVSSQPDRGTEVRIELPLHATS